MKKLIASLIICFGLISIITVNIVSADDTNFESDKHNFFSVVFSTAKEDFEMYTDLDERVKAKLSDEQNEILQSGTELYQQSKNYKNMSEADFEKFKTDYEAWKKAAQVAGRIINKPKVLPLFLAFIASIASILLCQLDFFNMGNSFKNLHFSNDPKAKKNLWDQMNFLHQEQNRHFMEESMKSVLPFDHGGYIRGDGLNPSDTMAADMDRQMQDLNNMNNMNHTNHMNF